MSLSVVNSDDYEFLISFECLAEIKRRTGIAKTLFGKQKELLKDNLFMKLKKMILNTYTLFVVSYGYEAWTYNSVIVKQLISFEM